MYVPDLTVMVPLMAGLNFNLRQDKFNFTANGFYNQNQRCNRRELYTDIIIQIHQHPYIRTQHEKNDGAFAFGSLGSGLFCDQQNHFFPNRYPCSWSNSKPGQTLNNTNNTFFPSGTDTIITARAM